MFRRRSRDDTAPAAPDGSEDEYVADDGPADDDDFADQDDEYDEDYDEGDAPAEGEEAHEDEEAATPGRRAARAEHHDLSDPTTWTRLRDASAAEALHARSEGPWDSGDDFPEAERIDLGSVLVPVRDGSDVQIGFSEEAGVTIAVVAGDSALQLQAFAAPRTAGLWDEVRPEIAEEVATAGGRSEERGGPFGPELLAWLVPQMPEGTPPIPPQPLRFLGVDGPRWFLRGLISGPAALDDELARPLEEAFAGVVVVRGDHAEPPRKPLDIQLPEQARQLFESQVEAEQNGMPNPFERGPEITETR